MQETAKGLTTWCKNYLPALTARNLTFL